MTHPNPSSALAYVIVDELVAGGVECVVISPGSRSAALAIAAANHPDLRTVVAIDERSAGFHALGVARAMNMPAAVFSTSGTAPANFFPAVVEADMACVPLVVVSADRPAETQRTGANQTIDQVELFGAKVRAYAGIPAPEDGEDRNRGWRETVAALLRTASGATPGPVHLNVAFREPTVPVPDDGRSGTTPYPHPTPRLELPPVEKRAEQGTLTSPPDPNRGLVIVGDGEFDRDAVFEAAGSLGWPILATALSGLRGRDVVTTYEHLLAGGVDDDLRPLTAIAIGSTSPSPALDRLVSAAKRRIRVDGWGRPIDPNRDATDVVRSDPVGVLGEVVGVARPDWSLAWSTADAALRAHLDDLLVAMERPSGPAVARALDSVSWGSLVVASSLPIRDVDAHVTRAGPIYANRGASGIDGFVSTALGVASSRERTLALCGDLSLLHDSNGFMIDVEIDLTIVVIDNGGGGLFDLLPQAAHAPHYERLFVADPDRDPQKLAAFHDLEFHEATSLDDMVAAVEQGLGAGGLNLISVPVDRTYDLEVRRRLTVALQR